MPQSQKLRGFADGAIDWMLIEGFVCRAELRECDYPSPSGQLSPGHVAFICSAIDYANTAPTTPAVAALPVVKPSRLTMDDLGVFRCSARSDNAKRMRPNDAITELATRVGKGQEGLLLEAACRIAVSDAAPFSDATRTSAFRSWNRFMAEVLHRPLTNTLPPTSAELAAWALTFQVAGTYQNYIGAIKSECIARNLDVAAWSQPLVARAITSVKKREVKELGTPAIHLEQLRDLVRLAEHEGDHYSGPLYLLSYWFLLRVPSEGLPLVLSVSHASPPPHSKLIIVSADTTCLVFGRRKNDDAPSTWTRSCKCNLSPELCPVHTLAKFTARLVPGNPLFPRLTKEAFNRTLKRRAHTIGLAGAEKASSKAFRRGHSRDLHDADCPSARLMKYAGWRSRAIFSYVPIAKIVEKASEHACAPAGTREKALFSDASSDGSDSDSSSSDS